MPTLEHNPTSFQLELVFDNFAPFFYCTRLKSWSTYGTTPLTECAKYACTVPCMKVQFHAFRYYYMELIPRGKGNLNLPIGLHGQAGAWSLFINSIFFIVEICHDFMVGVTPWCSTLCVMACRMILCNCFAEGLFF